jgi:RimJ/RimL family protein N-acetyltransferase
MSIQPSSHPSRSADELLLADGTRLEVRPITPGDRDALLGAFERLSPESRRRRFLAPKTVLTARELDRLTVLDHVTDEAVIALEPRTGRIVGVGRYGGYAGESRADLAITVADDWQGRGLGAALTARVVERARANGIARLEASTLWENHPARSLLRRLGFRASGSSRGVVELALDLSG